MLSQPRSTAVKLAPSKDYDLSELSVLHIDEDKYVRDVVRIILLRLGVQTITSVESVDLGLERLGSHRADLVLYGRPSCGTNGVRFTHMLRRSAAVLDTLIPVILVSSRVEFSNTVQARDEGIIEFFGSPISVSALYGRITRIIDNQNSGVNPSTFFGSARQSSLARVETHTFDGQLPDDWAQ